MKKIFNKLNLNGCKTIFCSNFGVPFKDNHPTLIKNDNLGFLGVDCKLCGSHSPWVNPDLIEKILTEKITLKFGLKVVGCTKCQPNFFDYEKLKSIACGFTGAGTPRRKCSKCLRVFTVPNFKNVNALRSVLNSIIANVEINQAIKISGLSARLYYFYLNQLSVIFSNYSRINEQNKLYTQRLVTHSLGGVVPFLHGRGVYNLVTAEANSGYILLQSNNLTGLDLPTEDRYYSSDNTLPVLKSEKLADIIKDRYAQNLTRRHFESLLIGPLKPIKRCSYTNPRTAINVHFQLLNVFTQHSEQYAHYIEHESCFRTAALVNSIKAIKKGNAEIYYYYPFVCTDKDRRLTGEKIGWWNDRWFSNDFGAYCSITTPKNTRGDLRLAERDCVYSYFEYLNENMKKGLNSYAVINNLFEIHRILFNYTTLKNKTTRAVIAGLATKPFSTDDLLDESLRSLRS